MPFGASTQLTSSGDPILRVRGVAKRFPVARDFFGRPTRFLVAVDNVSLEVQRGETLALVGESGSGKSTLARLVLRLTEASQGTVEFEGMPVFDLSGKELRRFRSKAQVIFQDPFESLDPRMKGEAIVAEGMFHLGMSETDRRNRIAELMHTVQLPEDAVERFPHEFSGGQRQRLSIARALAVDPSFIVADEPVSALDVSMQSQILNLMKDLQRDLGLTYLFISHDMSVVRHMADRVAVMYLGRIVELAPADELFKNPLHPYTQTLLSAVPNLLTGLETDRIRVSGEPGVPDGRAACAFAGRCFRAIDRCPLEAPRLEESAAGSDHWVACFNPIPFDHVGDLH